MGAHASERRGCASSRGNAFVSCSRVAVDRDANARPAFQITRIRPTKNNGSTRAESTRETRVKVRTKRPGDDRETIGAKFQNASTNTKQVSPESPEITRMKKKKSKRGPDGTRRTSLTRFARRRRAERIETRDARRAKESEERNPACRATRTNVTHGRQSAAN